MINDSLLPISKERTAHEQAIDELLAKAYKARVVDMKQALNLAKEALDKSRSVQYEKGEATAESHLALFLMITGKFGESRNLAQAALVKFQKLGDLVGQGAAYYTLGSTYYKSHSLHKGLKYLLQCRSLLEKSGNQSELARSLKVLGAIYEMLKEYDKALSCYNRCISLCQAIDDPMTESNATTTLSSIFLRQGELEKADALADRSIELKQKTDDIRGLAFALHAKGKVLIRKGQYEAAEPLFKEAISIHRDQGEGPGESMCLLKLGEIYNGQNMFAEAKRYFTQTVSHSSAIKNNFTAVKGYRYLYQIAKKEGQAEEALELLEKMVALKEVAIQTEAADKIKNMKLSAKIDLLEQETRIQQEKNAEIEAKNAELDTLIYRISHDIRGPIASLLGLHQVVNFEIQDPAPKKYFDLYHTQISRLNTIVMDLTNLSRVRNAQLQLDNICLVGAVEESLGSLEYFPAFSEFEIETAIDAGLCLVSDRSFVHSILQNLIENALKYGKTKGRSKMKISAVQIPNEEKVEIKVQDFGNGISIDHQERIFELFFRASTDTTIHGSGMGLYITKNAVKKLNGSIKVESDPNKGSTFTVQLPNLPAAKGHPVELEGLESLN